MNYNTIRNNIENLGFEIISFDLTRPWGGFLVIDETQAQEFSN
jgi:mannose-6-phosphate isomerase